MDKKGKILIVDDSEINRSLLTDMLLEEYEVLEAIDGLDAIVYLNQYHTEISLVLLDIIMPKMNGFEVLETMNKIGWIERIPVITISAETSSTYIEQAYDLGAVEYISRPFDEKTIKRRVRNIIMLYSKQKQLENMVTEQIFEKEKSNLIMIDILSHIVEFRNGESGAHVHNIRIMTEILLKKLIKMNNHYNLTLPQINLIINASALHDIGKISIPGNILNKPGKLTSNEYEIMKKHSLIGALMLESIAFHQSEELVLVARDICRWHHERYDGNGYPDGLKGDEIPIAAQVVALADVYDALTNKRVYKPAYSHERAMQMILDGECGVFNPLLLKCLKDASTFLKKELGNCSNEEISKIQMQMMTNDLIRNSNISNKTLALLEQERTKNQFFASMSNEIQFEYNYRLDLLSISEWGANRLGIDAVIAHPWRSDALGKIIKKEDYKKIQDQLQYVNYEDPIICETILISVANENRWHKLIARPLWVNEKGREVLSVIGKIIDLHEEQLELVKLQQLAKTDGLTNLYNRNYAQKTIENIIESGLPKNNKYAMLLFDLDYFKMANDQFGHMFGDQVLQEVAKKAKQSVREGDIIARVGGDEFLIFARYSDTIEPFVKRIFNTINGYYQNFKISISMGVSLVPENAITYKELFHHADQALYATKKNGRKQYCFYDDSMKGVLSVQSPTEIQDNNIIKNDRIK